ncbi:MAG TPA: hypothetical protein VGC11_12080 [Acidimicrobiia bacterium]
MRIRRLVTAIAVAAASLLLTAGYQASPELAIDPTEGPPGTAVTAHGSGFEPGTVEMYWDAVGGPLLDTLEVERNGGFTSEFDVPADAQPGPRNVIACRDRLDDSLECRQVVRAPFTVTEPPPPPTTTTLPIVTPTTAPTTTEPPIAIPTTSTTTSQPPLAIPSTTATIPDDFAITTTTLGGDPPAPSLPGALLGPTVTTWPPEGTPTGIGNIAITHIEVSQGLQNLANEFPLVEGRWTAVRIHGLSDHPLQAGVSGAVEVIRLSPSEENLGIVHASNLSTYREYLARVDINGAPYVLLDPDMAEGTVKIRAWVYAQGDVDASNEPTAEDNYMEVTVEFHAVAPVHIYHWPLYVEEDFDPDGDPIIHMPSDGWLAETLTAYRLWPVNALVGHPMNTVVGDEDSNFDLNFEEGNAGEANAALQELWLLADLPGIQMYNGMVAPEHVEAAAPYTGLSSSDTTWTIMGLGYSGADPWHHRSGATLTHESGHFFGLQHAPCSYTAGSGYPNEVPGGAVDPTFPGSYGWPDCSLAPTDVEGYYGLDVNWGATNAPGPTVMSNNPGLEAPNVAFPFMGYKAPKWLDPWHGCFVLDALGVDCDQEDTGVFDPDAPGGGGIPTPAHGVPVWTCHDVVADVDMCNYAPPPSGDPIENPPDDDWLVHVDLKLGNEDAPAAELRAMLIDGARRPEYPELTGLDYRSGPYVLGLVGEGDEVLWAKTLHVEEEDIDVPGDLPDGYAFVERVPNFAGGEKLLLVSPAGTLAELAPTDSPPELAVRRVLDGESLDIRLDVADPDGDVVHTVALYRPGSAADWMPVLPSTTKRRIVLPDTADLPGSDHGELRIVASDGWNTVETIVGGVHIPDHTPMLSVVQPFDASAPAGRPVRLEAQALDAEDGMLDGPAVAWTSSLDGPIAVGAAATIATLSEGNHLLTVVATDSAGNTATASVPIEITPEDLPGADVQAAIAAVFAGPGADAAEPAGDGAAAPAADDSADGGVPGVVSVMIVVAMAVALLGGLAFRRLRRRAHNAG